MVDIKKKEKLDKEEGSVLVLFAATLSLLLVFVALSTDIILAYNHRDHLNEIGQMMREARFDFAEEIWAAYDPEATLTELSREVGRMNGLRDDQVRVIWDEGYSRYNSREAQVNLIITDVYKTSTLGIFGIKEIPIKVEIKGFQNTTHGNGVWSPWR